MADNTNNFFDPKDRLIDPRDAMLHMSDSVRDRMGISEIRAEINMTQANEAGRRDHTRAYLNDVKSKMEASAPYIKYTTADYLASLQTLSSVLEKADIQNPFDRQEVQEKLGALSTQEQKDVFVAAVFERAQYDAVRDEIRGVGSMLTENSILSAFGIIPEAVEAVVEHYSLQIAEHDGTESEIRQHRADAGITDDNMEDRIQSFALRSQYMDEARVDYKTYSELPDSMLTDLDKNNPNVSLDPRTENNGDFLSSDPEERLDQLKEFLGEDLYQRVLDSTDMNNIYDAIESQGVAPEAIDKEGEQKRAADFRTHILATGDISAPVEKPVTTQDEAKAPGTTKDETQQDKDPGEVRKPESMPLDEIAKELAAKNDFPEDYIKSMLQNDPSTRGDEEKKEAQEKQERDDRIKGFRELNSESDITKWLDNAYSFTGAIINSSEVRQAIQEKEGDKGLRDYDKNMGVFLSNLRTAYDLAGKTDDASKDKKAEALENLRAASKPLSQQIDRCLSPEVRDKIEKSKDDGTLAGRLERLERLTHLDERGKPIDSTRFQSDPWMAYANMKIAMMTFFVDRNEYKERFHAEKPGLGREVFNTAFTVINFLDKFDPSNLLAAHAQAIFKGANLYIERMEVEHKAAEEARVDKPESEIDVKSVLNGLSLAIVPIAANIENSEVVQELKGKLGEEKYNELAANVKEYLETKDPAALDKATAILSGVEKQDNLDIEKSSQGKIDYGGERTPEEYLAAARYNREKIIDIIKGGQAPDIEHGKSDSGLKVDMRDARQSFRLLAMTWDLYKAGSDPNARIDYQRFGYETDKGRQVSFLSVVGVALAVIDNFDPIHTFVKMAFEGISAMFFGDVETDDYKKAIENFTDKFASDDKPKQEVEAEKKDTDWGIGKPENDKDGNLRGYRYTREGPDQNGNVEKKGERFEYADGRRSYERVFKDGSNGKELSAFIEIRSSSKTDIQIRSTFEKEEIGRNGHGAGRGDGATLLSVDRVNTKTGKVEQRDTYSDVEINGQKRRDITETIKYNSDGSRDITVNGAFGDKWLPVEEKKIGADGTELSHDKIEYDENGRIAARIDQKTEDRTEYTDWDKKGDPIAGKVTSKDGELLREWKQEGRFEVTSFYKDGKVDHTDKTTRDGKLVERTENTQDGKVIREFKDDVENRRTILNGSAIDRRETIGKEDANGNRSITVEKPNAQGMFEVSGSRIENKEGQTISEIEKKGNGTTEHIFSDDGKKEITRIDRNPDSPTSGTGSVSLPDEKGEFQKAYDFRYEIDKDGTETRSWIDPRTGDHVEAEYKQDETGRYKEGTVTRDQYDGNDPISREQSVPREDGGKDVTRGSLAKDDNGEAIFTPTEKRCFSSDGKLEASDHYGIEKNTHQEYDAQERMISSRETDPITDETTREESVTYDEKGVGHGEIFAVSDDGQKEKEGEFTVEYTDKTETRTDLGTDGETEKTTKTTRGDDGFDTDRETRVPGENGVEHVTKEEPTQDGEMRVTHEEDVQGDRRLEETVPIPDSTDKLQRGFDESGKPTKDTVRDVDGQARMENQLDKGMSGKSFDITDKDTGEKLYRLEYKSGNEISIRKYDSDGELNNGKEFQITLSDNGFLEEGRVVDVENDQVLSSISRDTNPDSMGYDVKREDGTEGHVSLDDLAAAGYADEEVMNGIQEEAADSIHSYLADGDNEKSLQDVYDNIRDKYEEAGESYSISDFARDVVTETSNLYDGDKMDGPAVGEKLDSVLTSLQTVYENEGVTTGDTFREDVMNSIDGEITGNFEMMGVPDDMLEKNGLQPTEINEGVDLTADFADVEDTSDTFRQLADNATLDDEEKPSTQDVESDDKIESHFIRILSDDGSQDVEGISAMLALFSFANDGVEIAQPDKIPVFDQEIDIQKSLDPDLHIDITKLEETMGQPMETGTQDQAESAVDTDIQDQRDSVDAPDDDFESYNSQDN